MKQFIVLLCCVPLFVQADDVGRGGQAGSFVRMGTGARILGMGGGGAALGDDAYAAIYNPAGLVFIQGKQVTASLSSMALDRKLHYIGYAQSLGKIPTAENVKSKRPPFRAGFALGWLSAGVDQIDARDFDGAQIGTLSMSEHAFYFSFAIQPAPFLGIGFSGKALYSRFPGILDDGGAMSSTGFGFDMGLSIRPLPSVSFGLVVQDLRSKYTWNSQDLYEQGTQTLDRFPRVMVAGVAFRPHPRLLLNANIHKTALCPAVFRGGIEAECLPGLFLRGGYNEDALAAGGGYRLEWQGKRIQIDYAYVPDPVAPRGDHVFSWSFEF